MSERNGDEGRPSEEDVRPGHPDDSEEPEESGDDESSDEPADAGSGEPGEEGPAGDEEPKPISVRDLMPSASSRPRRRSRPRGESAEAPGAPEETEEPPDEEESGESRPTPVRIAMDRPPPGDSRPAEELPSRRFDAEGEEWIVRITGRTITGSRPDPGALLMQLVFCRAEEPETPRRELLTVDRPLDALYEEDLQEFLGRSRPTEADGD